MRVAVLKGGFSSERDVSLVSGKACARALKNEGFDVIEIDVSVNLWEQLSKADPDIVLTLCMAIGVRMDGFKEFLIFLALHTLIVD